MENLNDLPEQQVSDGNGMESLAQMPSFEEKQARQEADRISFEEARRNGTLPEGVSDVYEYREFMEEKNARDAEADERLRDSQEFIMGHYVVEGFTDPLKEGMTEFANSKELKEITKHGFSLEWLAEKGIISKTDRWTNGGGRFGEGGYD